jgi:hypothetical protein
VIPVEAFESREARNRDRMPWSGPRVELRAESVAAAGGWKFEDWAWSGGPHKNVWMAEDFRFRWSLAEAAKRDAQRTAQLLSTGAPLYSQLGHAAVFCPGPGLLCERGALHPGAGEDKRATGASTRSPSSSKVALPLWTK